MVYPGFCGPTYLSQSPNADAERTVNLYPEVMESSFLAYGSSGPVWSASPKAPISLYPTPGLQTFLTLPTYPNKALFEMDGRAFAVSGNTFYELFANGTFTSRGTVAIDGNQATICSNGQGGNQLFITAGTNGYIFNLMTNAFSTVLSGVTQGAFLDGFFLAFDAVTSKLKSSALEDGTTWPAANVAQRNSAADNWVAMAVVHRNIWLFGSQTTEVWYDAGAFPFPFAPVGQGAWVEHGIIATFSLSRLEDSIVWLSKNEQGRCTVRRSSGFSASKISTFPVEFALQGYATVADATSFSYQDQGHTFYLLNFPTAGSTWGYDAVTGLWHERGFWDTTQLQYTAARPANHAFAFGMHLVGDRVSGVISQQAVTFFMDAEGAAIRRMRQAPHVNNEGKFLVYPGFQLDLEVGLGTVSVPSPQIMLQYSDSQGKTWSTEQWVSAGGPGAYQTRARWNRLGRSRDRIFRTVYTDPIPWRIQQAYLMPDPISGPS